MSDELLNRLGFPNPVLSSEEAKLHRMAFRNERNLYKRTCDLTGESIISIYSEDKPYKVYSQKAWWSDDWNAEDYAQDFDFNRPFFDQFGELLGKVPKVALYNIQAENSDYCNFCMGNKDCYLVFGSDKNRDCYYCLWVYECNSCVDCSYCYNSELLYECVDCTQCYDCSYLRDSSNCAECHISFDLKGCKNCIGCVSLRQQQYCIFNVQYSKENYERALNLFKTDRPAFDKKFKEFFDSVSVPTEYIISSEDVSDSNHVVNSKDVYGSTDVRNSRNIWHCNDIFDASKDCYGCSYSGEAELCYDSYEVHGFDLKFCNRTWPCSSSMYLDNCDNCENCFGCVGLRHKKYCILNKQYTKEGYELMIEKIKQHMISTDEWGRFFPISLSPFAYNETVAHEFNPLSKEGALAKGYNWKDEDKKEYASATVDLLPPIEEAPDSIANEILKCEVSGKNYRIIEQELKFYRSKGLPLPNKCPEVRHSERLKLREVV